MCIVTTKKFTGGLLNMFKYSITQWIFGNESIEKSFQRIHKFGYDGIELAAEPYLFDQEKVVDLINKYNVVCTSLCGIFTEERDLTSGDSNVSQNAVQYIKDSVDFASKVGAPYIIVVPSPVGRTKIPEGYKYDQLWQNAIKNIRKAANYAEDKGIRLCIEAINRYETYFVNTLTKAYKLVKEINHSSVGIMADMFHMSIEENNIGASLRMIADELMHVHLADNTREAPGMGTTDFREMLYILKDINYNGPLTMEFMPRVANPYDSSNLETQSELMDIYAERAINFMKTLEKNIYMYDYARS